jgi:protein phosphatase
VVAVLLWGHQAIATNVGDSPLFHYRRGDRTVKQLTLDHTVAAALVRGGMITAEMGKYHEGRNQLEFYLGRETLPGDPLIEISLEPGDRLLLCTDGISSPIDNLQLLSCLTIASLSESAQALIDTAQNTGSTDNQTLIIWQYGDSAISQATVQQIN